LFILFLFLFFPYHIGVRLPYVCCIIAFSLSFYCVLRARIHIR